jgi:hypothetical protein
MRFRPWLAALLWSPLVLAQHQAPKRGLGPTILHVPPEKKQADQGILTPVPIGLELPPELAARRVLVHYKVHGAPEWRTLELARRGRRYEGAIPCLEVSTITGDLRYYIRVHDAEGAVIAFSGTRSDPYRIGIHHESERPDLAAQSGRCPDPADCPPGLPGCPSAEVELIPCESDADCEGGEICGWEGVCTDDPRQRSWLGLDVEQQAGVVASSGACSLYSQENEGYACYRQSDGQVYLGTPLYTNEALGLGLGPTRVQLSFERLVFYDTSVGARVGYALRGGGPTPREGTAFMPFSAELHVTHWFGDDPFVEQRLRPYALLGGGFAMFDVQTEVQVREDPTHISAQGDNDLEQTLDVWKRAGDGFVVLGAGALYPFTEGFGPNVEIRVHQAFPYGATIVSGSLGVRLGL